MCNLSAIGRATRFVFLMLIWLVMVASALAADDSTLALRSKNLLVNPGFERDHGWTLGGDDVGLDTSVARNGGRSLRFSNQRMEQTAFARQVITLDQPIMHPIRVSGWSRAEDVEVGQDYDIYLDLEYADGTPLWGQIAHFTAGSHDWEHTELTFDVAQPVRKIEVFVFLRKGKGTVWFDDLEVRLAPFSFRRLRILPGVFGTGSVGVFASSTLPASWTATIGGENGQVSRTLGTRMPLRIDWGLSESRPAGEYAIRLTATDDLLGQTIVHDAKFLLEAHGGSRGYAVWTENSMRRVMPYEMPPEPATANSSDTESRLAKVSLARREYESFQVAILAAGDVPLQEVRVEVGDLVSPGTGGRISSRQIAWHQVGYVRIDRLRGHPADPEAVPGWWPEMLLDVEQFDVPAGFTQSIWVTVHAPPGTPSGEYHGRLVVRPRDRPASEVKIRAYVHDFDLPVRGHIKTAFALMDGFLERVYGKPLDAGTRRAFGDFVLRHRLNPDDISRTSPPVIEDLIQYRDAGLNAFNVLNLVEERGDATWVCWSPLSVYTPQFKGRLIERLDPYVDRLRQTGLVDRAYIYTFDEREEDFFPVIREYFGMVKERYPEIKTMTTAKVPQDPDVMRDLNVDWNCPLTSVYDFENSERCRAAGLEVWAYVCMGPGYPYANWLADHPLIEGRVIWWQAYHRKMDGLLYWGLNIWSKDNNDRPIDPSQGPLLDWSITTGGRYDWLHGDGVLVYPGIDGPIGSIRLANIRDGLEDYEYLWLLAEKTGGGEAVRWDLEDVTDSLTNFTRDPQTLHDRRESIGRMLGR